MLPADLHAAVPWIFKMLLTHTFAKAQTSPACSGAEASFAAAAHGGCWLLLPTDERPGHAYAEMFLASPLLLSSKRLFPSVHPSAGPQQVPVLWQYHTNPFMPSLAWISLFISDCAALITLACVYVCVCVCVILQHDAMKCCTVSQKLNVKLLI